MKAYPQDPSGLVPLDESENCEDLQGHLAFGERLGQVHHFQSQSGHVMVVAVAVVVAHLRGLVVE